MSFSDLKAARTTKSYVKSSIDRSTSSASGDPLEPVEEAKPSVTNATSSVHVVLEEGMYSALPSSVEIRRSDMSGRGVWAKQPIRAGTTLTSTKPYASVLSNQNLFAYCSSCFAPGLTLRRCTKCRIACYCDATCQNNDWPSHKLECTSLQKWFQAAPSSDVPPPSDAVRCLGRMLRKLQKNGPMNVRSKEIASMQSHRTALKPSSYELHTHFAHALVQYLGLSGPAEMSEFGFSSAADLVDAISRFVTNTFTITDPTLTPLGAAVSPVVALINHSCNPNAVVVFPRSASDPKTEPLMQVVAIRDIYPGEEILTSYIDITLPKSSRQKELEDTYYFQCQCVLCVSDDIAREALNCPKSCGGLCPLPIDEDSFVQCTRCKAAVKTVDAVLDAVRVGQEGLDKATALQLADPSKAIQLTTNLIPILSSAGLATSSHPLLGLTRLHQSLLTASFPNPLTQDHLDDTIRTATKNVAGLSQVLREGHPVLALAVAELGKLLAVDEPAPKTDVSAAEAAVIYPPSGPRRLRLAYDTLLRARKMLLIGFGAGNEGGQAGKEVREMIVALEKEIGIFTQGVKNVFEDTPRPVNGTRMTGDGPRP